MATLLFVQLEITRQHNRVMAREVSATEGVSLDDQRWGFWPLLPFGWRCRLRRALHPQGHGDGGGFRPKGWALACSSGLPALAEALLLFLRWFFWAGCLMALLSHGEWSVEGLRLLFPLLIGGGFGFLLRQRLGSHVP